MAFGIARLMNDVIFVNEEQKARISPDFSFVLFGGTSLIVSSAAALSSALSSSAELSVSSNIICGETMRLLVKAYSKRHS